MWTKTPVTCAPEACCQERIANTKSESLLVTTELLCESALTPRSNAGTPVWWWLTSLHRPPLPLEAMEEAAAAPSTSLPVTIEAYLVLPAGARAWIDTL